MPKTTRITHSFSARTRFWTEHFTHESTGGVVLALAALAALIASNSALGGWYQAFVQWPIEVAVGGKALIAYPLAIWVNDLLMAVFFFQVGLEIKREFLEGELSGPGQLLLPAAAALGGMAVPALWYVFCNWGDDSALRGWAIPVATDIAFALGVVALLGKRVPHSLKAFLTAAAIIDDLGAIVVIALFYTSSLSWQMLCGALVACMALWGCNRMRVSRVDVYAVIGLVMWFFVLKSGVHATLAGVLTALAIPMRTPGRSKVLEKLEHDLRPWVAFAILPVFAFVNAGVALDGVTWQTIVSPIPLGIALGLVLGKPMGVFGVSMALMRMGWVRRPTGASTRQLFGIGVVCGMGFTMSLFIGGLAFEGLGPLYTQELKIGVLGGSLIAGVLGSVLLGYRSRK